MSGANARPTGRCHLEISARDFLFMECAPSQTAPTVAYEAASKHSSRVWDIYRIHARVCESADFDSLECRVPEDGSHGLASVLGDRHGAAPDSFLHTDLDRILRQRTSEFRIRIARRVGTCPLSIPRTQNRRRTGGLTVCSANGRCRNRTHSDLLSKWLVWAIS